ncbi:hypothetical protein [Geomicrobium sp. JCM 19055]|uniref:hypothetical protein n=1 Tax=Geomicrobium sp. JCM 19055 TaxID=1460649 RepID=UPI00045ECCE9|nr:hypothetical protein [Geomicrobium sp. JCM 19055]GAJ99053.1 hypothetical protein JCM19055_2031 [Geomicrobium sp. JCM 19055]
MDEQNEFRSSRNDLRKKRTMNRIMNVSIGVVVVLIGFFMYHLLFSSSDEVADEENQHLNRLKPTMRLMRTTMQ